MDARQKIEEATWRCFHCDEVFTDEAAACLHFGSSERQSPACQIDVAEYRAMEHRMERYNEDDSDMHRQMYRMQGEHSQALIREEEKGYARGLADGAPYLAEREQTLASKEAELAEAGLKYVSLFGELQNALAEIERRTALAVELLNSYEAQYPSREMGMAAQNAWALRQWKAAEAVRDLTTTPQPTE